MSYWYCPNCKEELVGNHVTHQELCDYCGTRVLCIDEVISPERLEEILKAEQEGRLIVLPCKVGDTVYVVGGHIVPSRINFFSFDDEFFVGIHFDCDDDCEGCPFGEWSQSQDGDWSCNSAYGEGCIECKNFGKTVFLTLEEAEEALSKEV